LKKYEKGIFKRVFSYSEGSVWAFVLAILMAGINGAIFPIFSIFLSQMLAILVVFNSDPVQSRKDADKYALIFFLLGILAFIVNFFQMLLFSYLGE
jgi:hypothetical protein